MPDMIDVSAILKRAADKGGFTRTRYIEKDIPRSMSDIVVMQFWGDIRSLYILSALLLKRIREETKGSKYFILCSWPGFECFFPYVNEYWTIKDEGILKNLYKEASGFSNLSSQVVINQRNLNSFFEEVIDNSIVTPYYNDGITQAFWDRFKHIKVTKPSVPSSAILGAKFNREMSKRHGYKVFLYPASLIQVWDHIHGRLEFKPSPRDFWVSLADYLLTEGFTPVVYKNYQTHDISGDLLDRCIYLEEPDMFKVLGAIRSVDCTLDVFSSISRLAIAARSPFLACDERIRHNYLKEYEIDGLCCSDDLPREYFYTFPSVAEKGNLLLWKSNLFVNIIAKLSAFLPDLNRDTWPSPSEGTEIVPYANIKKKKANKLGVRFVKIEHD